MPVASAPAAFSVIEKQMRLSPLSRGLRNFSFWYSVPWARMVIIEASSGPCVFIDSAPSMLSPSSICTSALASGPRPMPPYSFGTNGHHRPCARAFFRSLPSTSSSGFKSSSFSAGMHSCCTHWRTFSRIALASAGTSKSIDMAGFLALVLDDWACRMALYPGRASGNDKQSLKRQPSSSLASRDDVRFGREGVPDHVRSRRFVSRLRLRMDQYLLRAHLCPRRRQGTAAVVAAWLFRNPCDVASRCAAIGRQVRADHRGPAGLRLVGHAGERQGSYALHQARDGANHDRGDGATRACSFCARRARSRRACCVSSRARSSRPAVAAGGAGHSADL